MVPREAAPRHTTGRKKGARPGMNTEDRKSRLDTEGTAVLYWVCLMIGVLMWMIGELTTTSHLRAITREVEVHDGEELDRALQAGATFIGVNNRNLKTLEVSLETSFELADRFPEGIVRISESGIRQPDDLKRLHDAGYQGFLVGESLMRQPDQGRALASLLANGT